MSSGTWQEVCYSCAKDEGIAQESATLNLLLPVALCGVPVENISNSQQTAGSPCCYSFSSTMDNSPAFKKAVLHSLLFGD